MSTFVWNNNWPVCTIEMDWQTSANESGDLSCVSSQILYSTCYVEKLKSVTCPLSPLNLKTKSKLWSTEWTWQCLFCNCYKSPIKYGCILIPVVDRELITDKQESSRIHASRQDLQVSLPIKQSSTIQQSSTFRINDASDLQPQQSQQSRSLPLLPALLPGSQLLPYTHTHICKTKNANAGKSV